MIENTALFDMTNAAQFSATVYAAALALAAVIMTVTTKAIVVVKTKR